MLKILESERWDELIDIFQKEFDSELPHASAHILADVDEDGTIRSFMVVEFLARIGQIHNTGPSSRAMFEMAQEFFEEQVPSDWGVIAIATEPRFENLCRAFDMKEIEGKVFRRDF